MWIILIILLGCFFQFSLDVIFSLIYKTQGLFTHWINYVISIGITIIIVYGLVFMTEWINRRYSWEKSPGNRLYVQIIMITLFVVIMVTALRHLLKITFFPDQFVRLLDETIIAVFFVIMALLLVLIDIGVNLLNKWRFSLAEIERFKKENLETQFEMLRVQVNPHFLFNSLNTLSSLIYQDQDMASHFVRELSSVYRYILEKRKADIVSLKEEVEFTDSYRYLLGLRFDKKLIFNINIDEQLLDKKVIPLTLQILIENAVKHNIISAKKPLEIKIHSQEDNTLKISNNLQKKDSDTYSSGIGLSNISSRLQILTDRKLQVNESNNEFCVTVPLLEQHEMNRIKAGLTTKNK